MSKSKKYKSTAGKVAAISPPTRELELYDCLEGITQVARGEQKFLLDPEYLKFRRELKDKYLLFRNSLDIDIESTKEKFSKIAAKHNTSVYNIFLVNGHASNLRLLSQAVDPANQKLLDLASLNQLASSINGIIIDRPPAKSKLYLHALLSEAYNNLISIGIDPSMILLSSDIIPFINGKKLTDMVSALDTEGWQNFKDLSLVISSADEPLEKRRFISQNIEAMIRGSRECSAEEMNTEKLLQLEQFNSSKYDYTVRYTLFNAVIYEQVAVVSECLKKYKSYFDIAPKAKKKAEYKDHINGVENIAWQAIIRGNNEIANQFLQPEIWLTYSEAYKAKTIGVIALYNPSLLSKLSEYNFLTTELCQAAIDFELDEDRKSLIYTAFEEAASTVMRKGLPLSEFNLLTGMVHLTPEDQTYNSNDLTNRFFSTTEEYHRVKALVAQEALENSLSLLQGITTEQSQAVAVVSETKEDKKLQSSINDLEIGIAHELKFRPSEGSDPLEIMLGKRLLISSYFNTDHIFQMEPAPLLVSSIASMISSNKLNQLINIMQERDNGTLEEILADKSKFYANEDRLPYFKTIKNILGNKEEAALRLLRAKKEPYSELEKDSLEVAARFGKSKVTSLCLDRLAEEIERARALVKIATNHTFTSAMDTVGNQAIGEVHKLNLEITARGNVDTCKAFFRPHIWNLYSTQQQAELLNIIVIRSGLNAMDALVDALMSNNLLTPEIINQASIIAISDMESKYIANFLAPYALSLETVKGIKQTTDTLQTALADNIIPQNKEGKYALFAEIAYLYGKEKLTIDSTSLINRHYDQLKELAPTGQQISEFRSHFADLEIWQPAEELIGLIGIEELTNTRFQPSNSKKKKAEDAAKSRPTSEILADTDQAIDIKFAELSIACRGFDKKELEKFVKQNIDRLREIKPQNQEEFEALFILEPSVITGSRKLIQNINSVKLKKSSDLSAVSATKAEISPLDRNIETMLTGDFSLLKPAIWRNHSADNQYKIFITIVDHPNQDIKKSLLNELMRESLLTSSLINRAMENGKALDSLHRDVSIIEKVKRSSREPIDILTTPGDKTNRFAELAYVMNDQLESASKRLIIPRLKLIKELIPENIQEFEQKFVDKEIVTGSRKLLRLIVEIEKDLLEKQQAKARSDVITAHKAVPKDAVVAAKAEVVPVKSSQITGATNLVNIGKKTAAKFNPVAKTSEKEKSTSSSNVSSTAHITVDDKAVQQKTSTPIVDTKEIKHEVSSSNASSTAHITVDDKAVRQKTSTPALDTKEIKHEVSSSNAGSAVHIAVDAREAQPPLTQQASQQTFVSREAIIEEIRRLSNLENSVHLSIQNQLGYLCGILGYNPMQPTMMVAPPPPQNQISYYNQRSELVVGEYRDHPQLGRIAYTQNQHTGEISQQPVERRSWAQQVRTANSSADSKVTQILQQGPRNEVSFKEAEDKRKQLGRDSPEI